MRVMCISNKDYSNGQAMYSGNFMEIGDEFTVVGECIGHGKNGVTIHCYDLDKYAHTDYLFDKRNFAVLPDTTDELVEETEKLETV